MDTITIRDLVVRYRIGVPAEERAKAQRVLVSIEMTHDFRAAAKSDDLTKTIDYDAVSQRLLRFGDDREWKLIEKLACDIAAMLLSEFKPASVSIEIKKFIIPETRYVSVRVTRP